MCLLEGVRLIETALAAGARFGDVFVARSRPWRPAEPRSIAAAAAGGRRGVRRHRTRAAVHQRHRNAAGHRRHGVSSPQHGSGAFDDVTALLVADRIGDPGNHGHHGPHRGRGRRRLVDHRRQRRPVRPENAAGHGGHGVSCCRSAQRMSVDEVVGREPPRTAGGLLAADADGAAALRRGRTGRLPLRWSSAAKPTASTRGFWRRRTRSYVFRWRRAWSR